MISLLLLFSSGWALVDCQADRLPGQGHLGRRRVQWHHGQEVRQHQRGQRGGEQKERGGRKKRHNHLKRVSSCLSALCYEYTMRKRGDWWLVGQKPLLSSCFSSGYYVWLRPWLDGLVCGIRVYGESKLLNVYFDLLTLKLGSTQKKIDQVWLFIHFSLAPRKKTFFLLSPFYLGF